MTALDYAAQAIELATAGLVAFVVYAVASVICLGILAGKALAR